MIEPTKTLENRPNEARSKSSWDRAEFIFLISLSTILLVSSYLGYVRFSVSSLMFVGLGIIRLRRDHADEVYLIFLTFFVVTYVCLSALIYLNSAEYINTHDFDISVITSGNGGIIHKAFNWYVGTSRDIKSEVIFLCFLTGLVVIPQVLSFVFGGLFGCGGNLLLYLV
jgi:hypothetical protein